MALQGKGYDFKGRQLLSEYFLIHFESRSAVEGKNLLSISNLILNLTQSELQCSSDRYIINLYCHGVQVSYISPSQLYKDDSFRKFPQSFPVARHFINEHE